MGPPTELPAQSAQGVAPMLARKMALAGAPCTVTVPVHVEPMGTAGKVKVAAPVLEAVALTVSVSCCV
jgi:hypothetical protein